MERTNDANGEMPSEQKGRNWKRIISVLVLISVLAASLSFYAYWASYATYRKNSIPADAFIVPWMKPNPLINDLSNLPSLYPNDWNSHPWYIDTVMAGALKLNMTFRIFIPPIREGNNNTTRTVPATVYLGHDNQYLYLGGKFQGIYLNPYLTLENGYGSEYWIIFFDTGNDGILTMPESGSLVYVEINPGKFEASGYEDVAWNIDYHYPLTWEFASDLTNGFGKQTLGARVSDYDNSTGTITMLFSRLLQCDNSNVNSFQMRPGERWVMGFRMDLGYSDAQRALTGFSDTFPKNPTTLPWWQMSNDSSSWPKLAIDLSNPPPGF